MKEIFIILFAVAATVFDIKTRRIPNWLVLGMFGVWLLLLIHEFSTSPCNAPAELLDCALGFLVGGGIFMLVYIISHKGLGGGDVKFMAAAGLYLGLSSTIPAILYGTILAALTGLVLILLKKITKKDKLPLAPFLLVGITIAVLAG